METPPSNIQARNTGYNTNFRLETPIVNNNEQEDFIRNEYLNKLNPSRFLTYFHQKPHYFLKRNA